MRGATRLLLLSAVSWYEKYCEEVGDSFEVKEAILMIAEDCYLELDDSLVDALAIEYNKA
jgi:hypothetical protein